MSITFYYAPMSSATRVFWALEELGLPYEKVKVDLAAGEHKTPEYLRLNPHGKVPALVVDGVPMFESLAMLLFLGERFGVARNLWLPHEHPEYPAALSWATWGTVTFSTNVFRYLLNTSARFPAETHNAAAAAAAQRDAVANLAALEAHLADREFFVAGRFTLVDLSIASFIPFAARSGVADLSAYPHLGAWAGRCTARPDLAVAMAG
jgi:glutathione S-transferase